MCESQVFIDSNPFHEIMFEYMQRTKFCDVKLIFNNERILVHGVVVAASSEYFAMNLPSSERNQHIADVFIENVDSDATKTLIEYCYTRKLVLNKENAENILKVANFLGMKFAVDSCCAILSQTLSLQDCVKTWVLAKSEYIFDLTNVAFDYVCAYYEKVIKSTDFLNLDSRDLVDILRSNLNVSSEEVVFESVKKWFFHDRKNRSEKLSSVLEWIKLPLLKTDVLVENIETMCEGTNDCRIFFTKALKTQMDQKHRSVISNFNTTPRMPAKTIIAVGDYRREFAGVIEMYHPMQKVWKRLTDMKCSTDCARIVHVEDKLILIGGQVDNKAVKTVESYDLKAGTITTLPSLSESRYWCMVITYLGVIYAIGGENENSEYLSSVECWDQKSKNWKYVNSMPTQRYRSGVATVNNEIFVVGGFNGQKLGFCEAFCPATGKWRTCSSMYKEREGPGVAEIRGILYVVGGVNRTHAYNDDFEFYDPNIDKWTLGQPRFSVTGIHIGVVDFFGNLMKAGGYTPELKTTSKVEMYDIEKQQWSSMESLNVPRSSLCLFQVSWKLMTEANNQ